MKIFTIFWTICSCSHFPFAHFHIKTFQNFSFNTKIFSKNFYNNCSSLIFPNKREEINLILNLKFEEIRNIINKRIDEFFKICEEMEVIENELEKENKLKNIAEDSPAILFTSQKNPIDQIFKKVLLENNIMFHINSKLNKYSENSTQSYDTNHPLANNEKIPNMGRSRVVIFSDMTNDLNFEIDQKLLFLMKRQNIHIDCISVGTNEIIVKIFIK